MTITAPQLTTGATAKPAPKRSKNRVVTWDLLGPAASALGLRDSFGLVWLLGMARSSEALALVLTRALATEAKATETARQGHRP